MKHHVVFLDNEAIAPSVKLQPATSSYLWTQYDYTTPEEVVSRLATASIAMTCSVPLRAQHLEQLPNLQMISLALTGTDIVDLDYCRDKKITVTNVPSYAANTVAEHTVAMMFELFRGVGRYHQLMQEVSAGTAEVQNIYFNYRIRDVLGKKIGIIGTGPIAQRLAELASGLGMEVYVYNRNGLLKGEQFMDLDSLLASCDVVSVHVPLTTETTGMIGARELGLMKKEAVIINTARGGIIDESALIKALKHNQIGGAALDVVQDEPLQRSNPIFELVQQANFILNPHVAWSSEDAMQNLINQALENITNYIEHRPLQNLAS